MGVQLDGILIGGGADAPVAGVADMTWWGRTR